MSVLGIERERERERKNKRNRASVSDKEGNKSNMAKSNRQI